MRYCASKRRCGARAAEKGLNLGVTIAPDVPDGVLIDASRVTQVIANLLSNAIKYTDTGEIKATLYGSVDASGAARLLLLVKDSGAGVAEAERVSIFEPYARSDRTEIRTAGGTGLGLPIARRLAQAMGGDVALIESGPNGSTFAFYFKAAVSGGLRSSEVSSCVSDAAGCTSLSVLVAEDHPVNQQIVQAFLSAWGHVVTIVSNGAQAVEAASGAHFDVILMDINMPILNGLDATMAIRAQGFNRETPIIGLSADAYDYQRQRGLDAGMINYVCKPIEPSELYAAIVEAVHGRSSIAA